MKPRVYCKAEGIRLALRKLMPSGEYYFCCPARCAGKAGKGPCRLPYGEVREAAAEKAGEEIRLARKARARISDGAVFAEYEAGKKETGRKAEEIIERLKPAVRERTRLYEEYASGNIGAEKYEELLCEYESRYEKPWGELEDVIRERERIDTLYGPSNPWLLLFSGENFTEADADRVARAIDRIEADTTDGRIEVFFKYGEWRDGLMKSISKGEIKDGEEEQEE